MAQRLERIFSFLAPRSASGRDRRGSRRLSNGRESAASSSRSSSFAKSNGNAAAQLSPLNPEPEVRALLPEAPRDVSRGRKTGPPPTKPGSKYVNQNEEDQMEMKGYRRCLSFCLMTWLAIVFTGGLLRLAFHWRPAWMLYCTHKQCPLDGANKILLVDQYGQLFVEDVKKIYPSKEKDPNVKPVINGNSKMDVVSNGDSRLEHSANWPPLVRPGPLGEFLATKCLIYFENKKTRYLWDSEGESFSKVRGLDRDVPVSYFQRRKGLDNRDRASRLILYGKNSILVKVQSILQILFQEVLEPFYVFQVFSVFIWYFDNYVYYASCIIVMSALSLTTSVYQIRKNQKSLKDTVHASDVVKVCGPNNESEDIPSEELVPGDVLIVPRHGCLMHCDAVLISGNCIVNESTLTGESVPVTKIPLGNNGKMYDAKEDARHTLFCGTKVIQTRYYDNESVKALVIRTGFLTVKGDLVKSIMFPKPVDFKFNRHIHKFIIGLACLAGIGMAFTMVYMIRDKVEAHDIILRVLDLVTIIIPPALPAAMTIGIVFAQSRLKKSLIYCISPRSINISGCVNCVCFDKTGTLTEDGLDLWGVVPVADTGGFAPPNHAPSRMGKCPFLVGMATCHSLTIIDRRLTGDPLDLKMFEATEWQLEEPEIDDTAKYDIITPTVVKPKSGQSPDLSTQTERLPYEVGIVRQFPFSSSQQRMSVIARTLGAENFELYCKGAPETIVALCDPLTVPFDFGDTLMTYTQRGYRVLALGFRPLRLSYTKAQRVAREELETDMTFLGLLVMENRLKRESTPVLETLKMANIRSIMVTGDNMLTALSVARDCRMIEYHHRVVVLSVGQHYQSVPQLQWHFSEMAREDLSERRAVQRDVSVIMEKPDKIHAAVSGKTFAVLRQYYPELLKKVAVSGTVFARMAPEQKQQLVELLQEIGYFVAMCGDGANDCGALKAAHAGVSLSETEASVASPFTSKTPNISCVPTLIREGRAALVTSFGVLKYMALYSLAQFMSVIVLYVCRTNLTDMEFLYIDLFLITVFVALFGRAGAFETLSKRPPPSSLIGIGPLSSVAFQVLLCLAFQMAGICLLWAQPWYKQHLAIMNEENHKCHDNYAIFAVSVFQYVVLAVVFSSGAPYRQSITSNKLFMAVLLIMTAFTMYLVINPTQFLAYQFEFELEGVPWTFRVALVAIAAVHLLLALLAEKFLINYVIYAKCQNNKNKKRAEYRMLEKEMEGPPSWLPPTWLPPSSSPVYSRSDLASPNVVSTNTFEFFAPSNAETNPPGTNEANSVVSFDLELEKLPPTDDRGLTNEKDGHLNLEVEIDQDGRLRVAESRNDQDRGLSLEGGLGVGGAAELKEETGGEPSQDLKIDNSYTRL